MLTDEQREAVEHADSHQIITACPGSGKTRVVAARVAAKVAAATDRRGLAVVSFTNTAVEEVSQRLQAAGAQRALHHPYFLGTFDQFVSRFLIQPFGLGQSNMVPRVVDSWNTLGVEVTLPRGRGGGRPLSLDHLTVHPDGRAELVLERIRDQRVRRQVSQQTDVWERQALRVYRRLTGSGIVTCQVARVMAYQRLQNRPWREALGRALAARFKEIVIDEAQDSNPEDIGILEWLAESGIQLTVVWDPDQAIYRFRGSEPAAVRLFVERLGFRDRRLSGNFRSAPAICRFAGTLRHGRGNDQPVGDHRELDLPVTLISYRGNLSPEIGAFYRDQAQGLGMDLERSAVLAHRLEHACACIGAPVGDDLGGNQLLRLLEAKMKFFATSAAPAARERILVTVERLLLSRLTGLVEQPPERICDSQSIERRWSRRLALQVLGGLPLLAATEDNALEQWGRDARAFLLGLDISCSDGRPLGAGMQRPRRQEAEKLLLGRSGGVAVSTIHAAKGAAFDSVLLAIPPDRGGGRRTRDLLAAWQLGSEDEAKNVIYVGVTRAERQLTVAIPRNIEELLLGILHERGVEPNVVHLPARPVRLLA